jgi:hypothetical protein
MVCATTDAPRVQRGGCHGIGQDLRIRIYRCSSGSGKSDRENRFGMVYQITKSHQRRVLHSAHQMELKKTARPLSQKPRQFSALIAVI